MIETSKETVSSGRIAILYTTFPVLSETFLQREIQALAQLGIRLDVHSLHRGEDLFEGLPVSCFRKWSLVTLVWRLPSEWVVNSSVMNRMCRLLFSRRPPSGLNFWENLLGIGFALVKAPYFRKNRPDHFHAVWASLPAMGAWLLSQLTGISFSIGAHAYDVFEDGGDWFLREKTKEAILVQTSTAAAYRRLLAIGCSAEKMLLVRRGLIPMPHFRGARSDRKDLRVLCIARLVEKKGLFKQLKIYEFLQRSGVSFSARVIGDGPLRRELKESISELGLEGVVTLVGAIPHEKVAIELNSADILFHTGIVAKNGDRDGLPNVIPEAMACGVAVVISPGEGAQEAIIDGETGIVCGIDDLTAWVNAVSRIQNDGVFVNRMLSEARLWVEENFDALQNAKKLIAHLPIKP
jgi:glycosyltransferase involved in cell wall biosynthesis